MHRKHKYKTLKDMDVPIKSQKRTSPAFCLKLKDYAKGYHATAQKSVHFMNDWEKDLSHTKLHKHNFYELAVVLRGAGHHLTKAQNLPLRPGSVFLIHPGESHAYEYTEPLTLMNFMFDSQILRPYRKSLRELAGYPLLFCPAAERRELCVDSATLAELDILLYAMVQETRQQNSGADLLLISHLLNLLVLLLRKSCSYVERERFNSDIGIAVVFMRRNYQKEINLAQLARLVNLSESSFFRKFREEMKTSPMQWLLNLRIRKAMEFLIRSDMNIGEIAAATGFSDSLYFSRQFRKQVGVSPKSYRMQVHGPRQIIHGMQTQEEFGDI